MGRFLGGGVSGAATATVSLYVTEISNDKYGFVTKYFSILELNLVIIHTELYCQLKHSWPIVDNFNVFT